MEQPSVSSRSYQLLDMSDSGSSSSAHIPPLILTSPRKKRYRKWVHSVVSSRQLVTFLVLIFFSLYLILGLATIETSLLKKWRLKNVACSHAQYVCFLFYLFSLSGCWQWVGSSMLYKTNWTNSTIPLLQVRIPNFICQYFHLFLQTIDSSTFYSNFFSDHKKLLSIFFIHTHTLLFKYY